MRRQKLITSSLSRVHRLPDIGFLKPAKKAEITPFGVAPPDRRLGIGGNGGKGGGFMYVGANPQATLVSEREIVQGVNGDALIEHLDTLLPKPVSLIGLF